MKDPFVYFGACLLLMSCASAPQLAGAPATQPATQTFQIINLGPAFSTFWALAQGKRFSEQEKIWERVIEKPNQNFYDSMVWMKIDHPLWNERRGRLLKKYFHKYRKLAPAMKTLFDRFDETLSVQIELFKKSFPDFEPSVPVYAAPTASFNGRASEGVSHGEHPVLAFGLDVEADLHSDPNILYSHELFHVYHNGFLKLENQGETSLLLSLWMEGFATFVSLKMHPTAPLSSVFMSTALPKVKQKDIPWLAHAFLKDLKKNQIPIFIRSGSMRVRKYISVKTSPIAADTCLDFTLWLISRQVATRSTRWFTGTRMRPNLKSLKR